MQNYRIIGGYGGSIGFKSSQIHKNRQSNRTAKAKKKKKRSLLIMKLFEKDGDKTSSQSQVYAVEDTWPGARRPDWDQHLCGKRTRAAVGHLVTLKTEDP